MKENVLFDRRPTYYPKAGLKPNSPLKAREFLLEDFTPEDGASAAPVPPRAAPPSCDDFRDKSQPLGPQAGDNISPHDLFKHRAQGPENQWPPETEPGEDIFRPGLYEANYEDCKEAGLIVKAAQVQAEIMMKKARSEAAALIAELKRREEQKQEAARQAIEKLRQEVRQRLAKAEAAAKAAEKKSREAELKLAEAAERIAALDSEKRRLERVYASRLKELENSKQALMAKTRAAASEEELKEGLREGRESGRAEAIEILKRKKAGLAIVAQKLERIHEDLKLVNSTLML